MSVRIAQASRMSLFEKREPGRAFTWSFVAGLLALRRGATCLSAGLLFRFMGLVSLLSYPIQLSGLSIPSAVRWAPRGSTNTSHSGPVHSYPYPLHSKSPDIPVPLPAAALLSRAFASNALLSTSPARTLQSTARLSIAVPYPRLLNSLPVQSSRFPYLAVR